MSVSALNAYGERAKTDPEVLAAAKAIGASDLQGHIEYARTLGYEFTAEDVIALAREQRPDGELTEEQLAAVSGGSIALLLLLALGITGAAAGAMWLFGQLGNE